MKNPRPLALALPAIACMLAATGVKADMASSEVLANTCFSCHGTDGHSTGAMPSINGKPAKFIEVALKAFRDGKRQSTVMQRIATGFNDDEIASLAAYFAKKPN